MWLLWFPVVPPREVTGLRLILMAIRVPASGVKKGRRVGQGETVGFVGQTGLTTAPHLDYRVQRYGRWINPASLDNEPAAPIPSAARHLFIVGRDLLRAQLDSDALPDRTIELERVGSETVVVGGY